MKDTKNRLVRYLPLVALLFLTATSLGATDRVQWMDSGRRLLIGDPEGIKSAIRAVEAELSMSMSPGEAEKLHASETMLVTAFAEEAFEEIENEALADAMRAHVAIWMAARGEGQGGAG